MAGVALNLVLDLDQCSAWAAQTGRSLDGMSFERPLKVAKLIIVGDIRENFAGQHAPDGTPWLPQKSRPGGQTLRDKGLLLAASTAQLAETLTQDTLTLTNNLEYAAIHQFGGTIHKDERRRPYPEKPWVFPGPDGEPIFTRKIKEHDIEMPQRAYMGVSSGAADRIGMAFGEFVQGVL